MVLRSGAAQSPPAIVSRCLSSGPAALAQLWSRQEPRTQDERDELRNVSASMRDARLLDAVLRVAGTSAYPAEERLAALSVLLRYYDNAYAPLDAEFVREPSRVVLSKAMHMPTQRSGAQSLPGDVRARIATGIARIATTDGDLSFRAVAHRVRQALAYDDPANTQLEPGAISLVAGCGKRVMLRSTADINLPVDVSVLGTKFVNEGGIRAGSKTKPTERLLGLPAGVVVASLGGREVARLSERNAPCPPGMPR